MNGGMRTAVCNAMAISSAVSAWHVLRVWRLKNAFACSCGDGVGGFSKARCGAERPWERHASGRL